MPAVQSNKFYPKSVDLFAETGDFMIAKVY